LWARSQIRGVHCGRGATGRTSLSPAGCGAALLDRRGDGGPDVVNDLFTSSGEVRGFVHYAVSPASTLSERAYSPPRRGLGAVNDSFLASGAGNESFTAPEATGLVSPQTSPATPGQGSGESPSLPVPVQVTGAVPWAEVLNESFRTTEDLNDSFKTFGSGCGGRGGPCRGGGDTGPGFTGFGGANESWGASVVPNESFATFGPRASGLGSVVRQRRKPGGRTCGRPADSPGRPADIPRRSQGGVPGSSLSAATDRTGSNGFGGESCPQSVSAVDNSSRSGHSGEAVGTVRDIGRHFGRPASANPPKNPPKVASCTPADHPGYTSRRACDS
jgi:hypothetical protein